jgi:small subunit ribosomal protein S2
VNKRLQRLKELELIDFDDVAGSAFTKKELLIMRREKDKLAKTLGGIRDMTKVPSAVWIVDTNKEHLAVDEARKLGIPIVAILDTNCDPDVVDYPIPGNDDAIRAVQLLTRVIADAAAEGTIARHAARTGSTEGAAAGAAAESEPLAEWERERLRDRRDPGRRGRPGRRGDPGCGGPGRRRRSRHRGRRRVRVIAAPTNRREGKS